MDDREQSRTSRAAKRDSHEMRQLPSEYQENVGLQQGPPAVENVARGRGIATSLCPSSKIEPADRPLPISTSARRLPSQKTYGLSRSATGHALEDITHRAPSNAVTNAANKLTLESHRTTAAPTTSQAISYVKGSTYADRMQAYHGKSTSYVPPKAPTVRSTSLWTTSSAPLGKNVAPCTASVDKTSPLNSRFPTKIGVQQSSVVEEEESSGEDNPDEVSMIAFNSLHRPTTGALTAVTVPSTSGIMADKNQIDSTKKEVRVAVRRGGHRRRFETTNQSTAKEESITEIEYPRRHAPVGTLPSNTVRCEPPANKYSSVTSQLQISSHIPVPIRRTKRANSCIEQSSSSAVTTAKPHPSFATSTAFPTTFLSGRTQSLPKQTVIGDVAALAPTVKRQRMKGANETVNDKMTSTADSTEQVVAANKGNGAGIPNIRLSEADNPAYVTEYSNDIFEHFREMEILLSPDFSYLWSRNDEFWRQRRSCIEVMSRICLFVEAYSETLFLAVNLLDRALSSNFAVSQSPKHAIHMHSSSDLVSSSHLAEDKNHIVAVTCVLIAAKYEERNRHSMACVYVNYLNQLQISIDAETFRRGEREILAFLDYRLGWPGPLSFLRRCSMEDSEFWARTTAKYILEVVMFDQRLLIHKPSMQAAAALNIGRRVMGQADWTNRLVRESGYTVTDLTPTVNEMLRFLRDPDVRKTTPFTKYMKYNSIPRWVDNWTRNLFQNKGSPTTRATTTATSS